MPAQRKLAYDPSDFIEGEGWVRIPFVVDVNGDRMITLFDDQGRPHARSVAEVVLESFVGPRLPGQIVRFKDGDRLNCDLANLEWALADSETPADPSRVGMIEFRRRADAMRQTLEGRHHSDSGELQAEDRLR